MIYLGNIYDIHTGKWINPYGGTHLLELHPELRAFTDFLFMLAGKLFQMGLKGFQLF